MPSGRGCAFFFLLLSRSMPKANTDGVGRPEGTMATRLAETLFSDGTLRLDLAPSVVMAYVCNYGLYSYGVCSYGPI